MVSRRSGGGNGSMSQANAIAIGIIVAAVGLVLLGFLVGLLLWKRRHASEASSDEFGSSSSRAGQPFHSGVHLPPQLRLCSVASCLNKK
jgi:H+/gluconate symporter-like permease